MNYSITIHLDANRKLTYTQDQLSDIKKNGSYGSSGYPIGKVAVTSFEFSCPATGVNFDDDLPRAKVEFEIDGGLVDVFFIDHVRTNFETVRQDDRMTVYCFDRLAFANQPFVFERPYDSLAPVGYCRFWEAYDYCLDKLNLFSLNPPDNMDYNLSLENDYTIRDVLGYIAMANGGNFCVRDDEMFFDMFGQNGSILTPLDYTRPQQNATFGWQCEYIVLSNGDETITIGEDTASPVNTLELNIPVHKNNLTSIIADLGFNVRFRNFIPFSVSKAKFEVDTLFGLSQTVSMGDRVDVGIYNSNWNIETQEFRTNYPIVCNMALSYTAQGVYGTVSAPDINETMGAFTFSKDRNKVIKETVQGTVKYGNKYGIKSVGKKTIPAVGADAETQKTELQIYNGEIIFNDNTDPDNIVQAGKLYIDENKNIKLDGLTLTTEITLTIAGWSETAPYTQSIAVSGIKLTDKPICDVILGDDTATAIAELDEWAEVNKVETYSAVVGEETVMGLTFTCLQELPSMDLNVNVQAVR